MTGSKEKRGGRKEGRKEASKERRKEGRKERRKDEKKALQTKGFNLKMLQRACDMRSSSSSRSNAEGAVSAPIQLPNVADTVRKEWFRLPSMRVKHHAI